MQFPPGATRANRRRSRWREFEFMFREFRAAVLPVIGLRATLRNWAPIARRLADSKRKRRRQANPSLS